MSTFACPACGAPFEVVEEETEAERLLRRPAAVDEALRDRDG